MPYTARAKEVIKTEIEGLNYVHDNLDDSFVKLVDLCLETFERKGKIVMCGVGKNAHVGHKIAATLCSTGSRSAFLHPVEAMHGDLGMLDERDLLVAMSYSGETDELLQVLPAAKRFNIPIVALTGNPSSSLADFSDHTVSIKIPNEACPFKMAPTTSTTATMALGDALAMVLMQQRKFSLEEYSILHPSGAIGRSITLRIRDIMRPQERTPRIEIDKTIKDAITQMTSCRAGSVLVVDSDHKLRGIFTDGDFRRKVSNDLSILNEPIKDHMTENPISLKIDEMAIAVMSILEEREIDDIPIVDDDGVALGLVDIQDLPKFKLM
ncbi:MAG: KpsF/GutQ family sugar-phosphate isomerase [Lentisphaeria bacterium]|nr:KpsF/GutQ family sugar-phosphate isomerase [Lentisphaeria bacterium]